MNRASLAYWAVAVFAVANALIFIMSLMVENESGAVDITRYLHYNLVLAVGYFLVFIVGRYSQSLTGLAIALFLFVVGLLVSQEMPENMPKLYIAGWGWLKWVLIAPILTTFLSLFIGHSETGDSTNQDPQKPNFRP